MGNYIGQISGRMIIDEEIMNIISNNARKNEKVSHLIKIGIQADPGQEVIINKKSFKIGKTGILQFNDVNITSIVFKKHPYKTLIDNKAKEYYTYAIIDYLYTDNKTSIGIDNEVFDSVMPHNNIK